MKTNHFVLILSLFLSQFSFAQEGSKSLFNGKNLKGWDTYIGAVEKNGTPIGLNKDPMKVFSVTMLNGEPVIHISGEVFGSLATKKEFSDYHLQMIFKWGGKASKSFNSGLLYHSFGPFGAGLDVWMSSHEFQLMTGRMGDSYCMGKFYFEIKTVLSPDGKNFIYSPSGEKRNFGDGMVAKNVSKVLNNEKPRGEWNTVDLYCSGQNSVHVVNGKVVMVNNNSGKVENGVVTPVSKGKIQIQSEGGELYIKKITIGPLNQIPSYLLNQ
jgi:hypothetical protein